MRGDFLKSEKFEIKKVADLSRQPSMNVSIYSLSPAT